MCLTAKQRMHGVHAELSDLPLGGHRYECHKRFELSVTEKERHALLAPFRQPNRRRRLLVAHSRRLRRPWSDEEMICDEELERHRHRHVGRDDESPGFERMTNKTSGASRKSYPQARDERLLDREWLPSGSIRCALRHSQTIAAVAGVGCCKFSIEGDHAYCDVDLPSGLDVDIK